MTTAATDYDTQIKHKNVITLVKKCKNYNVDTQSLGFIRKLQQVVDPGFCLKYLF